jgi:ribose 5-phosphate isomerase A
MDQDAAKKAAGTYAAGLVDSHMRIGLGTGSTTAYALEAIGRRIRREGLSVEGVPTSYAAERLAREHGIPLTSLDDGPHLDVALDGADEVNPDLDLIKGRGAAHSREKVVATQAERFVVLADPTKQVPRLGTSKPVPVEVLPMAVSAVMDRLESLGAVSTLRMAQAKDGPVVTDQGFWVVDAAFEDGLDAAATVANALDGCPGVLDHGLFLGLATQVLIGQPDGSVDVLGG